MKYLIKISELEEKNLFLESKIQKIDEYISELKRLKGSFIWYGKSANTFFQYYDKYIDDLENIKERMLTCLLFLKSYFDNYNEEYERLNKVFNKELELLEEKNGINKM